MRRQVSPESSHICYFCPVYVHKVYPKRILVVGGWLREFEAPWEMISHAMIIVYEFVRRLSVWLVRGGPRSTLI